MADPELLFLRIDALTRQLARLDALRVVTQAQFVQNPAIHDLAERYLHLAMECVSDIAHQLLGDTEAGPPGAADHVFLRLHQAGQIDDGLAKRLVQWQGVREMLVRSYLSIDHDRCWQAIQSDLSDLREFLSLVSTKRRV
jgi:uncharacterized protein YutE (UPF0331/DUF86 family)